MTPAEIAVIMCEIIEIDDMGVDEIGRAHV